MWRRARITGFALAVLLGQPLAAQQEPDSVTTAHRPHEWLLLPHLFYTPETRLAGGGVAGYYPGGGLGARASTAIASVTVTARRQVMLEVEPDVYLQDDRLRLTGGLRVMQYPDVFYGIGNRTTADMEEAYTARSVRIELQAQRELAPATWLGARALVRWEELTEVETGVQLAAAEVPGSAGGTIVGLGVAATRDRRDRVIAPRSGTLVEAMWTGFAPALGSDLRFGLIELDSRAYIPNGPGVLAVRARGKAAHGQAPFTVLPMLGGSRLLRGYREGRYRDDLLAVLEAEYRFPLWRRVGGAMFSGVGDVAASLDDFPPPRSLERAAGAGLRYRLNQAGVNVRLDWAISREGSGLYLSLGEAY